MSYVDEQLQNKEDNNTKTYTEDTKSKNKNNISVHDFKTVKQSSTSSSTSATSSTNCSDSDLENKNIENQNNSSFTKQFNPYSSVYSNNYMYNMGERGAEMYSYYPSQQQPKTGDKAVTEEEMLKQKVRYQVEYYFSQVNLSKDSFMQSNMDNEGYIPLSIIANFNKVKELTEDVNLIVEAIESSNNNICELNNEKDKIKASWKKPERTTLILREVPDSVSQEDILLLLKEFDVKSIKRDVARTWFVSVASEDEARDALVFLMNATLQGSDIKVRLKSEVAVATNSNSYGQPARPVQAPNAYIEPAYFYNVPQQYYPAMYPQQHLVNGQLPGIGAPYVNYQAPYQIPYSNGYPQQQYGYPWIPPQANMEQFNPYAHNQGVVGENNPYNNMGQSDNVSNISNSSHKDNSNNKQSTYAFRGGRAAFPKRGGGVASTMKGYSSSYNSKFKSSTYKSTSYQQNSSSTGYPNASLNSTYSYEDGDLGGKVDEVEFSTSQLAINEDVTGSGATSNFNESIQFDGGVKILQTDSVNAKSTTSTKNSIKVTNRKIQKPITAPEFKPHEFPSLPNSSINTASVTSASGSTEKPAPLTSTYGPNSSSSWAAVAKKVGKPVTPPTVPSVSDEIVSQNEDAKKPISVSTSVNSVPAVKEEASKFEEKSKIQLGVVEKAPQLEAVSKSKDRVLPPVANEAPAPFIPSRPKRGWEKPEITAKKAIDSNPESSSATGTTNAFDDGQNKTDGSTGSDPAVDGFEKTDSESIPRNAESNNSSTNSEGLKASNVKNVTGVKEVEKIEKPLSFAEVLRQQKAKAAANEVKSDNDADKEASGPAYGGSGNESILSNDQGRRRRNRKGSRGAVPEGKRTPGSTGGTGNAGGAGRFKPNHKFGGGFKKPVDGTGIDASNSDDWRKDIRKPWVKTNGVAK